MRVCVCACVCVWVCLRLTIFKLVNATKWYSLRIQALCPVFHWMFCWIFFFFFSFFVQLLCTAALDVAAVCAAFFFGEFLSGLLSCFFVCEIFLMVHMFRCRPNSYNKPNEWNGTGDKKTTTTMKKRKCECDVIHEKSFYSRSKANAQANSTEILIETKHFSLFSVSLAHILSPEKFRSKYRTAEYAPMTFPTK